MLSVFDSCLTRFRNSCLVWPTSIRAVLTHPVIWSTVGGVASVLIVRAMLHSRGQSKGGEGRHGHGNRRNNERNSRNSPSSSFSTTPASKSPEDYVTAARDKYLNMNLEEKRNMYKCGRDFYTLDNFEPWSETEAKVTAAPAKYPFSNELNEKISIFVGDITALEIDAVVNAANSTLMGGGGGQ